MAHRSRPAAEVDEEVRPKIEPVGTVKRELVSPTGRKVLVDVPVYPPFRLEAYTPKKAVRRHEEPEPEDDEQDDAEESED